MSIRVSLEHHTRYRYDRLVTLSPQIIRLRPAPHCRTPVLSYALEVHPQKHFINWQQDPFGNYLARLVFPDKTRELSITVRLTADLTVINPFDFFLESDAEQFPFTYPGTLKEELTPYLQITERGPLLAAWLKKRDLTSRRSIDFLVELNQRLAQDIRYIVRMEPGVQACEETLGLRSGSCRDSAWLLVQILRHLGLAARFVSGYLVQLTADQAALDGPSGTDKDFTDLHAWAECYLPGAGWVGLDPTSGLFAGEGHLPLACTPKPESAAPLSGDVESSETEFHYENKVTRAHEDPRVTKPYTGTQWDSIMALGHAVDETLNSAGLKLTQGGEPTFVSIDDMDGPQWNTAAFGKDKRRLAGDLLLRLKAHYAPKGLLHFGQGKWYPGEPLPRWSLNCYWRVDGEALWHDKTLLADDRGKGNLKHEQAQTFCENLARNLSVDPKYVMPAYEDAYYYAWREGNLPPNLRQNEIKLDDPLERARLLRLLGDDTLGKPAGHVLPLDAQAGQFRSSAWPLRRDRLYLLPGDSPIGLRLPLDSLPWLPEPERPKHFQRDPFTSVKPLSKAPAPAEKPRPKPPKEEILHTALCVESRNGHLYCFLPPFTKLEDFVALIAAVEKTAVELGAPVVLEGYEPPRDERLSVFRITPDPGVIEVNIQPSPSWESLVANTEVLYEEARLCRLGTEKFMLDGRHTGTGGGNHMTLGGATPKESPFLRRPELLASLVAYWQRHPGLSYLFSGSFIGPTSQAPRVDEARDDALYELEIALSQMPHGESAEPWLVDRLLRNLLTDITGNTHRSEFCIDKLYSPEGTTGRLGLVEMRAFEMPPHAKMSLVQALLVRSLLAWFSKNPQPGPLTYFGTSLHDRFMLPHFVWQDIGQVIADLNRAGFALKLDWFAPFFEFRFPRLGEFCTDGAHVELRFALEPWHVLGEELSQQGTARYVDSSVERLQVKVEGMDSARHILVCNDRRLPLKPACERGAQVIGVRYKAWKPHSGLHPSLPIDAPLRIDLVDARSGTALGGCTYHVTHPGGRNYDSFPVNANEAEARRHARFITHGGSGKRQIPLREAASDDFPYTFDLRRRKV